MKMPNFDYYRSCRVEKIILAQRPLHDKLGIRLYKGNILTQALSSLSSRSNKSELEHTTEITSDLTIVNPK